MLAVLPRPRNGLSRLQPSAVGRRNGSEQLDRVRIPRLVEHHVHRSGLDHRAAVHHVHALDELTDDGQVVSDEEVADPKLLAQRLEQVENLCLIRRVER